MSELNDLYQQTIMDHNNHPRNFHELKEHTHSVEGHNPLCGDELKVYLEMEGDVIKDISFTGAGCAISKASCSLMTATVKGKKKSEVEHLFHRFMEMVTSSPNCVQCPTELGKLCVFSGVCEFPTRVKCASLAWHTLKAALDGNTETVTTEGENEPNK